MTFYTPHQSKDFAYFLTREGLDESEGLTQSLSSARVDLNPHQVDAAKFALCSPLSKGALLADEVGWGKTIEAALVLTPKPKKVHGRVIGITLSLKLRLPTCRATMKRISSTSCCLALSKTSRWGGPGHRQHGSECDEWMPHSGPADELWLHQHPALRGKVNFFTASSPTRSFFSPSSSRRGVYGGVARAEFGGFTTHGYTPGQPMTKRAK